MTHDAPSASPSRAAEWRRRMMTGSTFMFGTLFLVMLTQALKAQWIERPHVEHLIARNEERVAHVSNLRDDGGRGTVPLVDLAWTEPDGRACRNDNHAVSRTFIQSLARTSQPEPIAVLVDGTAKDCTAVVSADVDYARFRASPMQFIGLLIPAFIGTLMGLLVIFYTRAPSIAVPRR